ncbi:MAG: DUF7659 family protein, partial [Paraclostridium sp.]
SVEMTYLQFKQKVKEEIDGLPIAYAFGQKQYDEMVKKIQDSGSEIVNLGGGCYCASADLPKIEKALNSSDELEINLKDVKFFEEALSYELANHEFSYTDDPTDALDVLRLSKKDLEFHSKNGSKLAKKILKYL